ncbi:MAG: GAF domain-containing protein [Calditrichaeota bacterium]|nr:MAG: GAF domain-containing protein [Calditrichota bacterium]
MSEILFNRYQVLETIQTKSQNKLYKVIDTLTGQILALKKLKNFTEPQLKEDFKFEFEKLQTLNSPNLVRVFDYGFTPEGETYFTMDFVEGVHVDELFPKLKPEGQSLLLRQIGWVLQYLHSQNLIHGDLKPENILVVEKEGFYSVRLIDFGLSNFTDKTRISGTFEYLLPEEIEKKDFTPKEKDFYALGVTIVKSLFGKTPFESKNHNEILRKKINYTTSEIEELVKNSDKVFRQLILELIPRERIKRLKNWQDFFKILQGDFNELQKSKDFHKEKFTGREQELEALKNCYNKLFESKSSSVLLEGVLGIGKSRFLAEFKSFLQLEEMLVFTADSLANSGGNFFTANKILTQILYQNDFSELLSEKRQEVLAKTFEAIDKNSTDVISSNIYKEEVFLNFFEFAHECSLVRPFVIILDNAQNEDEGGIELWNYFIKRLKRKSRTSILLISAQREEEKSPLLERFFDERITLKELTLKNVQDFLVSAIGETDAKELAEAIFEETKGHPLLLVETLGFLIQNFASNFKENLKKIPKAFEEIARKRIEVLTEEETELLQDLSIFGNGFEKEWVKQFFHSKSIDYLISSLIHSKFLEESENTIEFKHPKFQEIIYAGIPDNQKKQKHSLVSTFFEQNLIEHSEVLAFHLTRSQEPVKAIPYIWKSSQKAINTFAYLNAKNYFIEAENIFSKTSGNNKDLLDFEYNILDSFYEIAQYVSFEGQKERLQKKLEIALKLKENKRILQTYTQTCNFHSLVERNFEPVEKLYKEAQKYLPKDKNRPFADLLHAKARGLSFQNPERIKTLKEVLEIAYELNDFELQSIVLNDLAISESMLGEDFQALDFYEKAFECVLKIGSMAGIIAVKINQNTLIGKIFSPEIVHKSTQQTYEQSKKSGFSLQEFYACRYYLRNNIWLHKFDKILPLVQESELLAEEFQHESFLIETKVDYAKYYFELGYFEKVLEIVEPVIQGGNRMDFYDSSTFKVCVSMKAKILEQTGNFEKAKELVTSEEINSQLSDGLQDSLRIDLGKLLLSNGNLEEAGEIFNEVLKGKVDRNFAQREHKTKSFLARIQNNFGESENLVSNKFFFSHSKMERWEILWNHYQIAIQTKQDTNLIKEILQELFDSVLQSVPSIQSKMDRKNFLTKSVMPSKVINEYFEMHFPQTPEEAKEKFIEEISERKSQVSINTSDTSKKSQLENFNLEKIVEISRILNEYSEPSLVLNNLLDSAISYLKADRGLIIFYDKETEGFVVKAGRNVEKETISDVTKISRSIVKNVSEGGNSIFSFKLDEDERFAQNVSVVNLKIRSLLCVPLKKNKEIIGTIYLDSLTEKKTFVAEDVDFLETVGNLAVIALTNAESFQKIAKEKIRLQKTVEEKFSFHNIISQDEKMLEIFSELVEVAKTDISVLINGESGTGKELIARAIHFQSHRKDKNFVAIDCGAIPETMIESELFGHKKGSFSGAITDKKGLFEEADEGTIFLDEITNTSFSFQARLLRVLQEREIRRVGETNYKKVNVRVIAATNLDILNAIEKGNFREDLYFRLNNFTIPLPPLRERKGDIPLLVNNFVKEFTESYDKELTGISERLLDYLQTLEWKGNVRELRSVISEMVLKEKEKFLRVESLPKRIRISYSTREKAEKGALPLEIGFVSLDECQKIYIQKVLDSVDNNQTKAAQILELPRPTLRSKMIKLGII